MNSRMFSIALLISALPFLAHADLSGMRFNEGDFISAKQTTDDGQAVVKIKLSKSGKAKLKKLEGDTLDREGTEGLLKMAHADIVDDTVTHVLHNPLLTPS